MTQTRKRRGMRTAALLAQRWRQAGLHPQCVDVGAGRPGRDILNTPGLAVEVKAHGEALSLPKALRQANSAAADDEMPIVVWRHNGQGEKSIGQWTVTMHLADFEQLWGATNGHSNTGLPGESDHEKGT